MRVSEILRKLKPINKNLHDALKEALTNRDSAYYDYRYAQFTSLEHAISSGFSWKHTEQDYEYWNGVLSGINSADGSNMYYDELSFISELHRKRKGPKMPEHCATPNKLIEDAIRCKYSIGIRIQTEFKRYRPGIIDLPNKHVTMWNIIGSINWSKTIEGFSWWEKLRNEITDDEGMLIPEKLKNYERTTE